MNTTHPETTNADPAIADPAIADPAIADPVAALDRPFVLPEEGQKATAVPETVQGAFLTRMNFQVGGLELLCEPGESREVVQPPAVERVPNTAAWFKGIANIRGNLTPVVDLGEALGNRPSAPGYRYLMLFGRGLDSFGVLVDALPRNEVVASGKRQAPPPLPSLLEESVVAAYSHKDKIYIDLNVGNLSKTLSESLKAV